MHHRGPDQSGELFLEKTITTPTGEKSVHIGFGHQRLSILDLSDRSRQPFSLSKDILLYNGEIYNYREINTQLAHDGIAIQTSGDTETLYRSISAHRENALPHLNGMWAFSMYLDAPGKIFFSRDRYGKKPLFYYQDEHTFCASSTIKAIQLYLRKPINFNRDTLINYFIFTDLYPSQSDETHFQDIHHILPGHFAYLDLTSWELTQQPFFAFYDRDLANGFRPEPELLVELLKDSVRKRLISDRPIGLLLSGGIDSSLLLSTLVSLGMQDQCRVYMGETGRSADYRYAKECVEKLGIQAETVVLDYDNNTFERFMQVCKHQEKPVSLNGSSMGMPQMYEVIASQGVPVVLDGTGGDELFGGYWQRQFPYAVREARKQGNWSWLRQQMRSSSSKNKVKEHLFKSLLPTGLVENKYLLTKKFRALINPLFRADFGSIMSSQTTDPLTRLDMGFAQAMCTDVAPGGRLGEWLWHNDRNSMMSSVEGRSPLLDFRLNQFIYTAYDQKFSGVWNKLELRNAFTALTPLPTQWRQQKQGFRWDGKHFLQNNHQSILELISSNKCLTDLDIIDTKKLVAVIRKQPKLLKSTFFKQVLAISGVEKAFENY